MTELREGLGPALSSYEDLARMVDYAALEPGASEQQVSDACAIARKYRPGRFTVRPADLDLVVQWMHGSGIPVGTVVSYPHGADTTAAKLFAVRDALQRGAKAIETVLNPGKAISRQFRYVESELLQMGQECHRAGAELIVDFELGWMTEDLRVIACRIARRAEVDWVRAGTMFGPGEYTVDDLGFLTGKMGELAKVDGGARLATLEEVKRAHQVGMQGFQSANPAALLDAWTAELKQIEAERVGARPATT